jgi:hypothetical protein
MYLHVVIHTSHSVKTYITLGQQIFMSNVSIYINHKETVDLCTKYNCLDSELNKVLKATLLDNRTSRFFRELGSKSVDCDKDTIIDEYLANTDIGIISLRRSDITTKPVFTLKSRE